MGKLRRSRDAVHRALKALRQHGFLDWLRRYVPTGNEGRGVQVQQTSNAYRLSLPERARRLLGRMIGDCPVPDDFAHAREAQAAEIEQQIAALPMRGQMRMKFEDGGIAASMAVIWEGIQRKKERESASRTESMLNSFSKEI
ncbi:MAG: replication protein RepA [Devosia sp.]|nr:replication protein RepA [Devosia sp.]